MSITQTLAATAGNALTSIRERTPSIRTKTCPICNHPLEEGDDVVDELDGDDAHRSCVRLSQAASRAANRRDRR